MKAGQVYIKGPVWDQKFDPEGNFIKKSRTFVIGKSVIKETDARDGGRKFTPGMEVLTSNNGTNWFKTFFPDSSIANFEKKNTPLSETEVAKMLLLNKLDGDVLTGKRKCKNLS